ncbi:MAG: hypothetical protein WD766_07510 [Gemmatimonadota bacterium]
MNRPEAEDGRSAGTVEWYDAAQGVGEIRPDDGTPTCTLRSASLRECGLDSIGPGDRVRFRIRDAEGERTVTELSLPKALQRWEDEGGTMAPEASTTDGEPRG